MTRCAICPPATYGPIWTDEYAAAGGEPDCNHPTLCCWHTTIGCSVYEASPRGYTLSSTHAAILEQLEEMRRERENRTSVRPEGYTGLSRVELPNLESRSGASVMLNPSLARRFVSSRLSR